MYCLESDDMDEIKEETNKKKVNIKKILKIVGDVLFGLVIIFVLFISITNLRAKSSGGIPNIFGYGYVNVLSDSMNGDKDDSFKKNDMVFVKLLSTEEAKNLKVGDIITYKGQLTGTSETGLISHRIISASTVGNQTLYVTQGDNPYAQMGTSEGKATVYSNEVLAVVTGHWSGAGVVFAWFGSSVGFFVVVVCPCIIFLVYEIICFTKTILEYKQEKTLLVEDGLDPIQKQISNRKRALEALVEDGSLTQEQADASLQKYIESLLDREDNR